MVKKTLRSAICSILSVAIIATQFIVIKNSYAVYQFIAGPALILFIRMAGPTIAQRLGSVAASSAVVGATIVGLGVSVVSTPDQPAPSPAKPTTLLSPRAETIQPPGPEWEKDANNNWVPKTSYLKSSLAQYTNQSWAQLYTAMRAAGQTRAATMDVNGGFYQIHIVKWNTTEWACRTLAAELEVNPSLAQANDTGIASAAWMYNSGLRGASGEFGNRDCWEAAQRSMHVTQVPCAQGYITNPASANQCIRNSAVPVKPLDIPCETKAINGQHVKDPNNQNCNDNNGGAAPGDSPEVTTIVIVGNKKTEEVSSTRERATTTINPDGSGSIATVNFENPNDPDSDYEWTVVYFDPPNAQNENPITQVQSGVNPSVPPGTGVPGSPTGAPAGGGQSGIPPGGSGPPGGGSGGGPGGGGGGGGGDGGGEGGGEGPGEGGEGEGGTGDCAGYGCAKESTQLANKTILEAIRDVFKPAQPSDIAEKKAAVENGITNSANAAVTAAKGAAPTTAQYSGLTSNWSSSIGLPPGGQCSTAVFNGIPLFGYTGTFDLVQVCTNMAPVINWAFWVLVTLYAIRSLQLLMGSAPIAETRPTRVSA